MILFKLFMKSFWWFCLQTIAFCLFVVFTGECWEGKTNLDKKRYHKQNSNIWWERERERERKDKKIFIFDKNEEVRREGGRRKWGEKEVNESERENWEVLNGVVWNWQVLKQFLNNNNEKKHHEAIGKLEKVARNKNCSSYK